MPHNAQYDLELIPQAPVIYRQSTGFIWFRTKALAIGYSGYRRHKNNPESQALKNTGPIPRGAWLIHEAHHSKTAGPLALPLTPLGHSAEDRGPFHICGEFEHPTGEASRGNIILTRPTRKILNQSIIDHFDQPLLLWVIE